MWQNMVDRREETDNKIIRRIRYACWIPETTDYRLLTQYATLTAFPQNNGCTNLPQCYIIGTLLVLLLTLRDIQVATRISCLYKPNIVNLKVYEKWRKYFQFLKEKY